MKTTLNLKKQASKSLISYKIIVMILFAVLAVIGWGLLTFSSYATSGNELDGYENQKKALIDSNTQLTLSIAKSTSLPQIEKSAQSFGMVKSNATVLIKGN